MSRYTPFDWADDEIGGTPITAARLNALEAGAAADVPVADIDATGTPSGTTFLRGDGQWATPAGGGGSSAWGAIAGTLSDQTDLQAALDAKASLASPTFTGTPAVPTAAGGTNTTQAASTAFVKAALDALIAAAPGALDTLDELAAALGDDANFASTMTTALAAKAPLASPALTGNPTAPTASPGDNDTTIATTAFVAALGALKADLASPTFTGDPKAPTPSAGDNDTSIATTAFVQGEIATTRARYVGVNAQTGTTYTPVLADEGKLVTLSNAGAITVTMPQDSAVAIPVGATLDFAIIGAGMATFSAGTGATVNPTAVSRAQWSTVTAIKRAANTWLIVGDLA